MGLKVEDWVVVVGVVWSMVASLVWWPVKLIDFTTLPSQHSKRKDLNKS